MKAPEDKAPGQHTGIYAKKRKEGLSLKSMGVDPLILFSVCAVGDKSEIVP